MSDLSKSQATGITDHPLWPTILGWYAEGINKREMPAFLPQAEFVEFVRGLDIHDQAKRHLMEPYFDSASLGKFMCGEGYDSDVHRVLYYASGSANGYALCFAASIADSAAMYRRMLRDAEDRGRELVKSGIVDGDEVSILKVRIIGLRKVVQERTQPYKSFQKSLATAGLVDAIEAWRTQLGIGAAFDWRETFKYANRSLMDSDDDAASFWNAKALESVPSQREYVGYVAKENDRFESAKRAKTKRSEKGAAERSAAFKDRIRLLWVPSALWTMSDTGILQFLVPDRTGHTQENTSRINRDIIDLGYRPSQVRR